jgi:hypothetical protein
MRRQRVDDFSRIAFAAMLAVGLTSAPALAMDIGWNGFGSAYYGQALNENLLPGGFTHTHSDFTDFSQMGLNVNAKVTDEAVFAAQLIGTGGQGVESNFILYAQWAFLNYKPTDAVSIKVGRQLFPMLLASEYPRVGYLLPYRAIPTAVYGLAPFLAFDGFSAGYRFETGLGGVTVGVFGGSPILDAPMPAGVALSVSQLLGAQATLDGDGWQLRAQASTDHSRMDFTGIGTYEGHSQNYTVGYRFDRFNIVSWGEYMLVRTPDGSIMPPLSFIGRLSSGGRYIGRASGGYVLGGYRIGKFLPRYTFARSDMDFGIGSGKVTSHTIGLNYQASAGTVLKAEYEISLVPAPGGGPFSVTQPAGAVDTVGGAFYAGVDFIF